MDLDLDSDTNYYKLLGVKKNATAKQIKNGYKKMVTKYHPDKVKEDKKKECEDKMKEINEAYSVLNNDRKKDLYDRFGVGGLALDNIEGFPGFPGFPGFDDQDINDYSSDDSPGYPGYPGMFAGGMPESLHDMSQAMEDMQNFMNQHNDAKNQLMIIEHYITLEEAYNGKEFKINIERNNICKNCLGTGAKDKKNHPCELCSGTGGTRRMCYGCRGSGEDMDYEKCKKCDGNKTTIGNYKAQFYVPPGSSNNDRIQIKNEGHMLLNMTRGNIHIHIKIHEHPIFKRDVIINNSVNKINLHMESNIDLFESLCGFKINIEHLDGRILSFISNDVVKDGEIKCIANEGMPYKGQKEIRGNLYIKFNVIYPEKLTEKQKSSIYYSLTNKRYKTYNMKIPEENIEVECTSVKQPVTFGEPVKKNNRYDRSPPDSDDQDGCVTQ